jgi:hypothetical protein
VSDDPKRSYENFPSRIVMQRPFSVVDAALLEFVDYLREIGVSGYRFRRVVLTTGSVKYVISGYHRHGPDTDEIELREIGIFYVRMLSDSQTLLHAFHPHRIPHTMQHLMPLFVHFLTWLEYELMGLRALAQEDYVPFLPPDTAAALATFRSLYHETPAPPVGRPPSSTAEWARQEVARGRDRNEVLQEYLRRENVALDNEEAVRQAKDRFRKALKRRTKRN